MTEKAIADVKAILDGLTEAERHEALVYLRSILPRHPAETLLNAPTEVILEAICRSSDLTVRGIEGIIAEAIFEFDVLPTLKGWRLKPIKGDPPYDFLLADRIGDVQLQVKMQRRRKRQPLMANEIMKKQGWPGDYYVVETQRTRTGKKGGALTRPYKFGSFDILAVSIGASQGRWSTFYYTLERWLLPSLKDRSCIATFQPVPPTPRDCWTADFTVAVRWLRSKARKRIWK